MHADKTILKPAAELASNRQNHIVVRIALVGDTRSVHSVVGQVTRTSPSNWNLTIFPINSFALRLVRAARPDAILVEVGGTNPINLEFVHAIKTFLPKIPLIAIILESNFEIVLPSVMSGALGCFIVPIIPDDLKQGILNVLSGQPAFCKRSTKSLVDGLHLVGYTFAECFLSRRERQIANCLLSSLSNKEIADRLGIATNTVHVILCRLMKKLEVHSRREVVDRIFRSVQK